MADLDWRTVRELMALRTRLKELMEAAILPNPVGGGQSPQPFDCPTDIWENDTELVVEIELPGATSEGIEVRLEGDRLVVSGELPTAAEDAGGSLRIERYRGPFRRTLALPAAVAGSPMATLRWGVLEIRLPKKTPSKRRIIVAEGAE